MALLMALLQEAAVRAWEKEPLVHVQIATVAEGVVVARCDTQEDWWGFFGCYGLEEGRVAWKAEVDEEPGEQSIHRVRGFARDGRVFVEVVGKTHMGNGSLYLYELKDRKLRTVLRTRAYDRNNHESLDFAGGCLEVEHRAREVELRGTIRRLEDGGVAESWACRKVFVWSDARRVFVEDSERREGFDRYPEAELWR